MNKLLAQLRTLLHFDYLANFLNQRSAREKLMILGFGGLLVLALDGALWFMPVLRTLTTSIPQLSAAESERQNMREDQKNEAQIRARYERLEREWQAREKTIEAANQIPTLLEDLSKLAGRSGVRITSLDPPDSGTPATGKQYVALPITIKAAAGMHELGNFISSLETGATVFKVRDLKIAQNPQNPRKHSIELRIETYRKAAG